MKNILLVLFIATGFASNAQTVTQADIVGTYEVSKLYLNDTLFYDKSNPEKSDKNVLIEIGKLMPYMEREDSTIAIALFYKDIYKALLTRFTFNANGTVNANSSDRKNGYTHLMYTEQWVFNEKKQRIDFLTKGKVTGSVSVTKVNGVVTLTLIDKKEKTKLELVKMY